MADFHRLPLPLRRTITGRMPDSKRLLVRRLEALIAGGLA